MVGESSPAKYSDLPRLGSAAVDVHGVQSAEPPGEMGEVGHQPSLPRSETDLRRKRLHKMPIESQA